MLRLLRTYKSVAWLFLRYWKAYGGFKAVITSPYVHCSIFVSVLVRSEWLTGDWTSAVLNTLPGLLGFALGGYAILLGFSDEGFRSRLAGRKTDSDPGPSPFILINATFVHFILIQILAILLAVVAGADSVASTFASILSAVCLNDFYDVLAATVRFAGYTLFVYAWFLAAAVTMSIFRLSCTYDNVMTKIRNKKSDS